MVFKKVERKTPVSILFTVEGTTVTQLLTFSLLPEPQIAGISHTPERLSIGKNASIVLKPVITYTPEKIGDDPAEKFVLSANRTLTYTASNTAVAEVVADGTVTTKEAGSCIITMTAANGKTGIVTLDVSNKIASTALTSLTADTTSVYFGHGAALTAVLEPADSWGNLEWKSDNKDVTVTVDPSDEKKASVSVAKAAKKGTAKITVTARSDSTLTKDITLTVDTVIPSKLVITCSDTSDKMYMNEELAFTAKGLNADGNEDAKLLQEVKWEVTDYLFTITGDGKLTCKYPNLVSDGEKVTVTAYSAADNKVYATKKITVCKNIADIQAVSCVDNEHQPRTHYLMWANAGGSFDVLLPRANITLKDDDNNTCYEFVISEKTEFDGAPSSDYLETAVYTINKYHKEFPIKPKKHTGGKSKTFYVYPIDPKTGKAKISATPKSFELAIWNPAKITATSIDIKDYTFGVSANPKVTVTLESTDGIYPKFAITETSNSFDGPSSTILEKAVYDYDLTKGTSNTFELTVKPRTAWEEDKRKKTSFRLRISPIDPHTGQATDMHDIKLHLPFHVWDKATGIEIVKGNFNIYEIGSTKNYESGTLTYGSKGFYFYARVIPETAGLNYKIERYEGNHICIVNHKKSDSQDKQGWIKYEFDTNGDNTLFSHDKADFVFTGTGQPSITQFLRIDSN